MFTRTRGKNAKSRCTKLFSDGGSALYCECGCQTPRDGDTPAPDALFGVSAKRSDHIFNRGEIMLYRNGVQCGMTDPAKDYLALDGNEYMGVESGYMKSFMHAMYESVPSWGEFMKAFESAPLYTGAESAKMEELVLAESEPKHGENGYCRKCHSWCYGDCEA